MRTPARSRPARIARWGTALLAVVVVIGTAALAYGPIRPAPPPRPVPNEAFRSASSPERAATVWAVGDGADGSDAARALAERIGADRPDRLLYLGDVYERGSRTDFRNRYDTVYGRLAGRTAPTAGNHDWPAHEEGYDRYWSSRTGSATPPWYAFRVGGWQIISLNSEAPHDADSAQLDWLRTQLRRTSGTCTLAFWHRPLQSAGRHGDQADITPLWNALRGRARVVVNGHDHDLQRLLPRDGITQFVAGAGGRSRYKLEADPRVRFGDDANDGALRMRLRSGRGEFSFVAVDGTVLDRSSVSCDPSGR